MKKTKKEILTTSIYELGIKGWKLNPRKTERLLSEDIIYFTVDELFKYNHRLLANKDLLYLAKNRKGKILKSNVVKDSLSWRRLRDYLLNSGFTYKDSVLLLEQSGNPKRYKIELLSKNQIAGLPVYQALNMKISSYTFNELSRMINCIIDENLTFSADYQLIIESTKVEALLGLKAEQLNDLTRNCFVSLKIAQEKLKKLGFTEKDGSFMRYCFSSGNSINIEAILIKNHGISKKDAQITARTIQKVRW